MTSGVVVWIGQKPVTIQKMFNQPSVMPPLLPNKASQIPWPDSKE